MESNMFCYQCWERLQRNWLYIERCVGKEKPYGSSNGFVVVCSQGHSVAADTLRKAGCPVPEEVNVL